MPFCLVSLCLCRESFVILFISKTNNTSKWPSDAQPTSGLFLFSKKSIANDDNMDRRASLVIYISFRTAKGFLQTAFFGVAYSEQMTPWLVGILIVHRRSFVIHKHHQSRCLFLYSKKTFSFSCKVSCKSIESSRLADKIHNQPHNCKNS